MGLGLPRVVVNEKDLSYYVDTMMKGISCVAGITEKGPINKPMLVSSEMQYERIFGGDIKNSDFPLICKLALSYGATLWVSRAAHYTNVAAPSTLTAASAFVILPDRNPVEAKQTLKITASSPGNLGDGLSVRIT